MHVGTFVYTPKIRDGQDFRDGMEAAMARPRRRALQPSDIEGLEYFDTLVPFYTFPELSASCDSRMRR